MAGYKVYLGMNGKDYAKIIKQKPSIAVIEFTEFTDAQIKNIEYWVVKAVRAAEAMFVEGASGDAKREYVTHFIQDKFNKNGKELITDEQIRILLEAAWEEYIKDRQKKNGTN